MNVQRAFNLHLFIVIVIILTGINGQLRGGYRIPRPTATLLSPRGFRISIPDERGIALFAFHGSVNKRLKATENGDLNGDTRHSYDNEWSFETTRYQLKPGDELNFWIYVQHNNFGYRLENQRYIYPTDFVQLVQDAVNTNNENNYQNVNEQNYDKNGSGSPIWDTVEYTTQRTTARPFVNPYETPNYNNNNNHNGNNGNNGNNNVNNGENGNNGNNYEDPYRQTSTTRATSRPTIRSTQRTTQRSTTRMPPRTTTRPNHWQTDNQNQSPNYNSNQNQNHLNQNQNSNFNPNNQNSNTDYDSNASGIPFVQDGQNQNNGGFNSNSNPTYNQNNQNNGGFNNNQNTGGFNTGIPTSVNQNNPNQHNQNPNQNNYNTGIPTTFNQNTPNQNSQNHQNSNQNQNNQNNQNQNSDNSKCNPSMSTMNGRRVNCRGALLFDEQFTGDVYQRWTPDVRMPLESEDAEFVLYQSYSSVWNVSYGNLHIYPKLLHHVPELGFSESDIRSGHYIIDPRDCTSLVDPVQECQRQAGLKRILPPVVTAKIRSKKSFSFKYGRVEIRAKLPKGDWIFPQLLLEPTQNVYRGVGDLAFLNGQVRIAFIRGNEYLEKADGIPLDGKFLAGQTIIAPGDNIRETSRKSIQIGQDHFGNDFHTYSLVWTNTSIKFAVDGLEYGTDTGGFKQLKTIPNAVYWEAGTTMAPFDQEFHISLGVGVGGNADFPDDSMTGLQKLQKPWENTSPKAELNFYLSAEDQWYPTWNSRESGLIVDYVKVYSV